VDMAGVTFIDVVGLHGVLQVAAGRNGAGPLVLRNAPHLAWLLDVLRLSELPSIVVCGEGERRVRRSHPAGESPQEAS
jgi:hypothetical protein